MTHSKGITKSVIVLFTLFLGFSLEAGAKNQLPTSPSFTNSDDLSGEFPFGVWLQDPVAVVNGKTTAEHYKNMGMNHWMGIYEWPDETIRYPGYNLHAAQELQLRGFTVYAGEDLSAVQWNLAHPSYASTFRGYLAGDEPDMTKQWNPSHHPDVWRASCQVMKIADPNRKLWANFGKGFAKIPWVGYQAFPGPTIQDDHNKFTDFLDLASVDLYGFTDSYEMPDYVGLWTYIKAVKNTRYYVDANPANPGIPVWGFVETGNPFTLSAGMYPVIPPAFIKPTVWGMIIAGAEGVIYFAHHFFNPGSTGTYPISLPAVGDAVRETNDSVKAFGAVLAQPSVGGTVASTNGPVEVNVLTKNFGNATYIFAMGDGNQTHKLGHKVRAEIAIHASNQLVEVLGESRSVVLSNDRFSDDFGPYQMHVYRLRSTGLSIYGNGTPGCTGNEILTANCCPTVPNPGWQLRCTNAPPSSGGVLLVSTGQDLAGSDPFGIGLTMHVRTSAPHQIQALEILSGVSGLATLSASLPNVPEIIGISLYTQAIWLWPSTTCSPTILRLSSSNGLEVKFQP